MALNAKQLQHLKKAEKRRARRPVPSIDVNQLKLTISEGEKRRYTASHANYLLRIEQTITECASQDPLIDDCHVRDALAASIRGTEVSEERVKTIVTRLAEAADFCGADNTEWKTGLRIIYTSVITWSNLEIGETNYLQYARKFLGQAKRIRS